MPYYKILHTHRHGDDSWTVKTQSDNPLPTGWFCIDAEESSEEELQNLSKRLASADIDFEPDRGEIIEIFLYDLDQEIKEV